MAYQFPAQSASLTLMDWLKQTATSLASTQLQTSYLSGASRLFLLWAPITHGLADGWEYCGMTFLLPILMLELHIWGPAIKGSLYFTNNLRHCPTHTHTYTHTRGPCDCHCKRLRYTSGLSCCEVFTLEWII